MGLSVHGITLDLVNDKVYWTNRREVNPSTEERERTGVLHRANINGDPAPETIVPEGISRPTTIAVDPNAGKLYWGEQESDVIKEANLDGTDARRLVAGSLPVWSPEGGSIAFDGAGGVYVIDAGGGQPVLVAAGGNQASWQP